MHPRTHLLSSGRYSLLVTNAGSGRSTCRGLDVTRWREDRTRDNWGQFCYVRDLRTGRFWSAGYQPTCGEPEEYEVVFSTDKAEFRRLDGGIETHLEIAVSPENPAEIRRLTLTNHKPRAQELDVTSYVEVVLNPHAADVARKRSLSPLKTHSCATAGLVSRTKNRCGSSTSSPSTAQPSEPCNMKPTGPVFSAAAGRRPIPRRWTGACAFRERPVPFSTRS